MDANPESTASPNLPPERVRNFLNAVKEHDGKCPGRNKRKCSNKNLNFEDVFVPGLDLVRRNWACAQCGYVGQVVGVPFKDWKDPDKDAWLKKVAKPATRGAPIRCPDCGNDRIKAEPVAPETTAPVIEYWIKCGIDGCTFTPQKVARSLVESVKIRTKQASTALVLIAGGTLLTWSLSPCSFLSNRSSPKDHPTPRVDVEPESGKSDAREPGSKIDTAGEFLVTAKLNKDTWSPGEVLGVQILSSHSGFMWIFEPKSGVAHPLYPCSDGFPGCAVAIPGEHRRLEAGVWRALPSVGRSSDEYEIRVGESPGEEELVVIVTSVDDANVAMFYLAVLYPDILTKASSSPKKSKWGWAKFQYRVMAPGDARARRTSRRAG